MCLFDYTYDQQHPTMDWCPFCITDVNKFKKASDVDGDGTEPTESSETSEAVEASDTNEASVTNKDSEADKLISENGDAPKASNT